MIDRIDLETLSPTDEQRLRAWQHCKVRYDGMNLFGFDDREIKGAYLDALKGLDFEDPYLAGLAREAKAESGEAARLKLVELSFQIADLFPLDSKLIQ